MELKNQVVSLDLAKRLKELGVKQDGKFYWYSHVSKLEGEDDARVLTFGAQPSDNFQFEDDLKKVRYFSAFTVAELGEMLHRGRLTTEWGLDCICKVISGNDVCEAETEADARAKMLIYLIENNLIPTHV